MLVPNSIGSGKLEGSVACRPITRPWQRVIRLSLQTCDIELPLLYMSSNGKLVSFVNAGKRNQGLFRQKLCIMTFLNS